MPEWRHSAVESQKPTERTPAKDLLKRWQRTCLQKKSQQYFASSFPGFVRHEQPCGNQSGCIGEGVQGVSDGVQREKPLAWLKAAYSHALNLLLQSQSLKWKSPFMWDINWEQSTQGWECSMMMALLEVTTRMRLTPTFLTTTQCTPTHDCTNYRRFYGLLIWVRANFVSNCQGSWL